MSALEELRWRDEILQALFWMRGEGLSEQVTASELARFLVADESTVAGALAGLVEDGYLEKLEQAGLTASAHRLTPLGVQEGGRRFQDEFGVLTRQAHGECGPGCWCQDPEHQGEPCPSQPREPEDARV
jgi:hypothetical protein